MRIEIYDTTLRDGTQGRGVTLSLVDKLKITQELDNMGFDYIEGGYPLSNPKDVDYFQQVRDLDLKHAKVCAFGMTRRKGIKAEDDPGMKALVDAQTPVITIVGKTWDLHVDEVLRVSHQENLDMIQDSVAFCAKHSEVFYDAEHFFDGYKANADYAVQTLQAAVDGGATRLILCDTNGGSLPNFVKQAVNELTEKLKLNENSNVKLGIHVHNDGGLAVANSLIAVEAGAVQVQGTINGIGERCGNVDLLSIIANLELKLDMETLKPGKESLVQLTELSRLVYELANLNPVISQPFVGEGAFAHKGGMHVHAVQRIAHSYEHVEPESVGNERVILVSELSGASNIAATLGKKFGIEDDKDLQRKILNRVQDLEHEGYQFEAAQASFELLFYEAMDQRPNFWELDHYRCVILRRDGEAANTEAIVKLHVTNDGKTQTEHRVADGDGPVAALDQALRKALRDHYPSINDIVLTDYKVRIVNPKAATEATTAVTIDFLVHSQDGKAGQRFTTIGVSENVIDASWRAITDAFSYHLIVAK